MLIRVLFVCLGNICRSPMAEAVFRKKLADARLSHAISVDSAATGDWNTGKGPHRGVRELLLQHQIDCHGITARQVKTSDLVQSDYILAMDSSNLSALQRLADRLDTAEGNKQDNGAGQLRLLLEFYPEQPLRDVPDPYYTGNFAQVYELIDVSSDRLLSYIRERERL